MITYAIGDVHGRLDLLRLAETAISRDRGSSSAHLVFLGDYVDRGPDSRGVIQFLIDLQASPDADVTVTCLRGNHEDMMLTTLRHGALRDFWLKYGGKETLRSYGTVPEEHLVWLETLPYIAEVAGRIFVHAGLAPGVALVDQEPEVLSCIRDRFLLAEKDFVGWPHVVHGHTPVHPWKIKYEDVELLHWRTNLDSGAFYTGVLSVGVFEGDGGPPSRVLRVRA